VRIRNLLVVVSLLTLALAGGMWSVSLAADDDSGSIKALEPSLIDQVDSLTGSAAARWPDEFGGVWYVVPGKPQGGIQVGFTSNSQEKVDQLKKEFSEPDLLTAIEVPKSQVQISREMDVVIRDRELAKDGKGALAEVDRGMFDMDADLKTGEILVMMPKITDSAKQVFAEKYPSDRFRFVESPLGNFGACNSREDCLPQLRGGLQNRDQSTPYGLKHCSTSFTVWANDKTQVLSAAHCSDANHRNGNLPDPFEKRWNGPTTTPFGDVVRNQLQGAVDAERISLRDPNVGRGWIYKDDTHKEWPIQERGSWATVPIGGVICRVGNTTSYSCGEVLGKNYSPTKFINTAEKYVRTDACSSNGDSGGAWFRDNKAWGIHAGWIDGDDDPKCDNDPMQSYFSLIDFALDAMNASMVYYNP